MYTVYLATNSVNGKRYVGVTAHGICNRSRRHLLLAARGARQCPRLYDAIRKHGAYAFSWLPLAYIDERGDAYRHERLMVSYLAPEYNVAPGGIAGPPSTHRRKPVICLTDGRIFPSALSAGEAYGVHTSNIAGACRGDTTTAASGRFFQFFVRDMTGTERSGAIDLIVEAGVERRRRGDRPSSPPTRRRSGRPVVCVDSGEVFSSASEAARAHGAGADSISRVCRGVRGARHVKGKRFAYVADARQGIIA